jgi:hypothetical protein
VKSLWLPWVIIYSAYYLIIIFLLSNLYARRIFNQIYFENKKLLNGLNRNLKIVISELATFIAKSAKA